MRAARRLWLSDWAAEWSSTERHARNTDVQSHRDSRWSAAVVQMCAGRRCICEWLAASVILITLHRSATRPLRRS